MEHSHNHSSEHTVLTQDGSPKSMPIAVVGMGCRFPGDANSPEKFWDLLATGRNAWSEIPKERFNQDALYHPLNERLGTVSIYSPERFMSVALNLKKSNVAGAHFLNGDVGVFDAAFFNFTADVANVSFDSI